ncbi:potassium transporter Kup [bacterium]|nr:potassium transporter Kup [bacterium]
MNDTGTGEASFQTDPPRGRALALLSLTALGVVYGDIGTSPLYALRECFHGTHAVDVTPGNVLGVLSLIFWALTIVIAVKYLLFVLRADNQGEGGILALAALITPVTAGAETRRRLVITLGLFGAALLYADGMITPAISVLSAVEGLEIATPALDPYIEMITVVILIGLFFFQSRGTAGVGVVFGPVTLIWMLMLLLLGLVHIVRMPSVLQAVNPLHAVNFFREAGWPGFAILGAVFLVVTGGEALYADIGHFGKRPIRVTWYAIVLPSLLVNYFGQGAFLISTPEAAVNPFYHMAPNWSRYPLVILATLATVIASQAVITGAFSLTLQAIQLGYSPRLRIEHTSSEQMGQIYIPAVNWSLMVACIGLVLGFGSSSNLAAAYGVAITITMVITTVLFFQLATLRWKWTMLAAVGLCGVFLIVDLSFFGANIIKVAYGGWFPLLVAGGIFTLMSTWRAGRKLLGSRLRKGLVPLDQYLAQLLEDPPQRVPGIAVFMSSNPNSTPSALHHNLAHNKVLHEQVVILTVTTAEVPRVRPANRIEIEEIGEGFLRIGLTYGFMDEPNVPRELNRLQINGLTFADQDVSYFLGGEILQATEGPGLALWREHLFAWMSRNAQRATTYYRLPAEQVIEIGVQVEL